MRAYFAAFAVIALLAGCAPGGGGSALDPTPTPTPSAAVPTSPASSSPSPDPVPTVAAKPELADLLISHAGLGPVAIGTDLTTLDPIVSIFLSTTRDCGDGVVQTVWTSNYPLAELSEGNLGPDFDAGIQDDGFDFVAIYSPGPRTAEGIRVGSTRADLIAAYPGIAIVSTGSVKETYGIYGSPANLAFDVQLFDNAGPADAEEVGSIRIVTYDPARGTPGHSTPSHCG